MTGGIVLTCTTIFLNTAVSCEHLLLLITRFFFRYVTLIQLILQHQCQTRVRNEYVTSATRVRHACDTSATRTSATQVKNFDCDSDTNENIFSLPNISYMVIEKLHGEEQFHSNNYLLEMPSYTKMRLFDNCTTKTEVCNGKSYIKMLYTRLYLQMPLHVPAQLQIVTQLRF